MTTSQLSGLLSGLAGISILIASFFNWYQAGYDDDIPKRWPRVMFAVLIAVLAAAMILLFI